MQRWPKLSHLEDGSHVDSYQFLFESEMPSDVSMTYKPHQKRSKISVLFNLIKRAREKEKEPVDLNQRETEIISEVFRCHSVLPTLHSVQFDDNDSSIFEEKSGSVKRHKLQNKSLISHNSSDSDQFVEDSVYFEDEIPFGAQSVFDRRSGTYHPLSRGSMPVMTNEMSNVIDRSRCKSAPKEVHDLSLSSTQPSDITYPSLNSTQSSAKTALDRTQSSVDTAILWLDEQNESSRSRLSPHRSFLSLDRTQSSRNNSLAVDQTQESPRNRYSASADRSASFESEYSAEEEWSPPPNQYYSVDSERLSEFKTPSVRKQFVRRSKRSRSYKKNKRKLRIKAAESVDEMCFAEIEKDSKRKGSKPKVGFFTNLANNIRSRDPLKQIRERRKKSLQLPPKPSNVQSKRKLFSKTKSLNEDENNLMSVTATKSSALSCIKNAIHTMEEDAEGDFVTFRLKIRIREGHGLVIRDASGSSDPYVRVKYNGRNIYKTNTIYKNLNPQWDEEFAFLIDDPTRPVEFEVYDYDRFMSDDFMGGAKVELALLKLFQDSEHKLILEPRDNSDDYLGFINVSVNLTPLTQKQREVFLQRATRGVINENVKRNTKTASMWISAVNLILIEARLDKAKISASQVNGQAKDDEKPLKICPITPPDVQAKIKLGSEKVKSKVATKTFEPKWMESFDLHVFDANNQVLDIMLRDNNKTVGKLSVDLKSYPQNLSTERWFDLENGAGEILLVITISKNSCYQAETMRESMAIERNNILSKYSISNSFKDVVDIGHLVVKVYKAEGLASADLGGKSDPFCVLELVNARLQTHTEYKTLHPNWQKLFTFSVKDIHEVLEVTVYDEDPNNKVEFLGKVAIPLLKIRNCERRWYCLKDRKLQTQVKGRILLEMDVIWNPVKAAIRTFNPRERKFIAQEPKFKRATLVQNVNRLREFWRTVGEYRAYMQSCLDWESTQRSLTAMTIFMLFVYFVEIYHIPLLLLGIFARCHLYKKVGGSFENRFFRQRSTDTEISAANLADNVDEESDDNLDGPSRSNSRDKDKPKEQGEKSQTLRGRINQITDTLAVVQNSMDFVASLLERIRNTFNFTVPYLSYLAIFVLSVATVLLYFIPLRWLVMIWGLNKFTKRLRKPHYVENNELLDFLSRVPCDADLKAFREPKSNCEETAPLPPVTNSNGTVKTDNNNDKAYEKA
ncbi:unnamed protein product [Bursaphelenchus xylophilus]|uniref:(pine wood nematode) hypothetical protein n=1 Tax=Bursaphelenchus xylophilus TaxID=6326 RepID=A0A1I7RLP5_BURXY|nr:unnamed protein product [Bursaphelenchus xylophilus]CAG9082736.1 unnamed protein product [Bursaphelenchus xylophilus]